MTFDELLVEQTLRRMRRPVTAAEAAAIELRSQQPGMRRAIASMLVRFGAFIDRSALETASATAPRIQPQ